VKRKVINRSRDNDKVGHPGNYIRKRLLSEADFCPVASMIEPERQV
jgi:hypothetical protein